MAYVYIGENFRKFDLHKNRIYKEKPEKKIQELKSAGFSLADFLFVEVADLPQAQKDLQKKGTPIFQASNQLKGVE